MYAHPNGRCPCKCIPHSTYPGMYAARGPPPQVAPVLPHQILETERETFFENIISFNKQRDVTIRIPSLGHVEVDLFQLYRNVTFRGGMEAVAKSRSFRQVAESIGIPETSTNSGYLLKKHYENFLYAYEIVHYWGGSLEEGFAHEPPLTPAPPPVQPQPELVLPTVHFDLQLEEITSRPLFRYDYTPVDDIELQMYEDEDSSLYKIICWLDCHDDVLIRKGVNNLLRLTSDSAVSFFPPRFPMILSRVLRIAKVAVNNWKQSIKVNHFDFDLSYKCLLILRNLAQSEENAKYFAERPEFPELSCTILEMHTSSDQIDHVIFLTSLEFFAAMCPYLSITPLNFEKDQPGISQLDLTPFLKPLTQLLTSSNVTITLASATCLFGLFLNPLNEDKLFLSAKLLVPAVSKCLTYCHSILFNLNKPIPPNFPLFTRLHLSLLSIIYYFSIFGISSKISVCTGNVVQCLVEVLDSPTIVPQSTRIAMNIIIQLLQVAENRLVFRPFYSIFMKCACGLNSDLDDVIDTSDYDPQLGAVINEVRLLCCKIVFGGDS
ncbi:hypothetical protein P9112_006413 [Eukaryota sp. TZLM1-RC]